MMVFPVAPMSPSLIDGAVPPNSAVETLYAMAKPAKRTGPGNIAGKVAEIVEICGMYRIPSTASPMSAHTKPLAMSMNIGIAATKRLMSEKYQTGLRPTLSESIPPKGMRIIMNAWARNITVRDAFGLMPTGSCRYVGM